MRIGEREGGTVGTGDEGGPLVPLIGGVGDAGGNDAEGDRGAGGDGAADGVGQDVGRQLGLPAIEPGAGGLGGEQARVAAGEH